MNIYRVAEIKNATRVVAIHNHPSGRLPPSEADKDITDRLIQVGRILNITFVNHLIITPITYVSFKAEGWMDELEKSLKYVPTYQVIEQIRKEEQRIARDKIKFAQDKTKTVKDKANAEKKVLINALLEKQVSIENIAKILEVTPKQVSKIINMQ